MGCGCNKKKSDKNALINAKKAVKKRRNMPLVTIRRKALKRTIKK
jgi:hypothetical protein